jgi:hypothetical protein
MFSIEVTGLEEIGNGLLTSKDRFNSYFSFMEENIQQRIIDILVPEAPFLTGNLVNHILPDHVNTDEAVVTISEDFVPYIFRVLYGFKTDGSVFSPRGHELISRLLPVMEEAVSDEVEKFMDTVFDW